MILRDATSSAAGLRNEVHEPAVLDKYLADYYSQYIGVDPDPKRLQRRTISKTDDLRFVARHSQPGRFLSVGCGDGLELQLAAEAGWTPEGYDVDPNDPPGRRAARRQNPHGRFL